ncbi:MAG: hypothetical protein WCR52_15800 [Bacteroidota bacterium]
MIYVFTTYKVTDPEKHREVFSQSLHMMAKYDVKPIHAFQALEDPNEIHYLFEAPNAEAFTSLVMSPEVGEAIKESTAQSLPDVQFMVQY